MVPTYFFPPPLRMMKGDFLLTVTWPEFQIMTPAYVQVITVSQKLRLRPPETLSFRQLVLLLALCDVAEHRYP